MKDQKWIMWIIGLLLLASTSVSAYSITRIDNMQSNFTTSQKYLSENYVMKSDYRIDLNRLEESLKCVNEKLDRLLQSSREG